MCYEDRPLKVGDIGVLVSCTHDVKVGPPKAESNGQMLVRRP